MRLARNLLDFEYGLVGHLFRHSFGHLVLAQLPMNVRDSAHCWLSSYLLATTRHTSELFRVKKPLVDLHARKTCLFHSLALDLGTPVAVEPLEEVVEVLEL